MSRAPRVARRASPAIAAFLVTASIALLPSISHAQVPHRPAPPARPAAGRPARPTHPPPPTPAAPEPAVVAPIVEAPPVPVEVAPPAAPPPPPPSLASATVAPAVPPLPPLPALDVEVGFRAFGRNFWFTDDIFQQLRPYKLLAAPGLSIAAEWYPGGHFTSGLASHFGIVATGELGLGLGSSDAQGRDYATTAYGFTVGARARLRLWRIEGAVTLGYGQQGFTIDRTSVTLAPAQGIPSVTYQSVRMGLSARIQVVRRFAALVSGTYLAVVDAGEVGGPDFFPRSRVGGVEVGLGGAFLISGHFEARLHLEWRRYFHAMLPEVGDRLIAGGAVDDFYAATLSLAYRR